MTSNYVPANPSISWKDFAICYTSYQKEARDLALDCLDTVTNFMRKPRRRHQYSAPAPPIAILVHVNVHQSMTREASGTQVHTAQTEGEEVKIGEQ